MYLSHVGWATFASPNPLLSRVSCLMIIGKIKWIANSLLLLSLAGIHCLVPVAMILPVQIPFSICRLVYLLVVVLCAGALVDSPTCVRSVLATLVIYHSWSFLVLSYSWAWSNWRFASCSCWCASHWPCAQLSANKSFCWFSWFLVCSLPIAVCHWLPDPSVVFPSGSITSNH